MSCKYEKTATHDYLASCKKVLDKCSQRGYQACDGMPNRLANVAAGSACTRPSLKEAIKHLAKRRVALHTMARVL